ncbi:hypothetical protein IMG5_171450 [Ichthyophthirius multifiliis]|uniref:Uncharacterized protein n=1 Tax=Ichthyophthirius multifiliis TaxID=5932 RepID=G0R1M4_ICHMU|nr:hypothetical protein IMG5_171450 [Ichthyophthirius multifiliis]EGR28634.1 hypothetical protein IMG5_171450 [Ichthyophthirius multifiliis]|eukprot:XP_004029870.1 hypothetical protein IMG5_171450 [Ichthyophthirius multifiliis]
MKIILFHRHGARLPAVEDYYPEDWTSDRVRGDLTNKGIQQLLKVGKTIRRKYVDEMKFLPKVYDPLIYKVKIAQLSRCMLSLLSMLNGLYPDIYQREHQTHQTLLNPKKKLNFSTNLKDHEERDLIFRAQSSKNCQIISKIYHRRKNEDKFEQIYNFFIQHPVMNSTLTKLQHYREKRNGKSLNHQIISLGTEKIPPLSATLFIELWEKSHLPHLPPDNRFFVKFYYGKKELEIMACRNRRRCTWKEFKILFKTRIKPNLEVFCDQTQD